MTATDEIRARLDELGIEHFDHENGDPLRDLSEAGADPATSWRMDGASVCAVPNKQGTFDLWIDNCTPEQVIAATVGADEDETDARALMEAIRDDDGVRYSMDEVMDIMRKDVAATVGKDIERYDGSGRRGTVAILQGGRKPEEVMFVGEDGGVTHYLPEGAGTCKAIDTGYATAKCSECGAEFMGSIMTNEPPDYVKPLERCPSCGRRIKEEAE